MKNSDRMHWEVDERGRRYRKIGNSIEYYPTIQIHGVEVEYDPEFISRAHVVSKTIKKEEKPCPFWGKCLTSCARYTADGCGLVTGAAPTVNMKCPFGTRQSAFACQKDCALWSMCNKTDNSKAGGN